MAGMKALLLVFFDVESPVAIDVPAQVDGSELNEGLGHLLSPTHSRTFPSILDEVFACSLNRTTGDGPALGKIFVITHSGAIAIIPSWDVTLNYIPITSPTDFSQP